ncbi:MAG: hypothetical protein ACL7BU_14390 [Candidatus Phlomobacter fragariae]
MIKENREDERKQLMIRFSAHLTSLAYQILHQKMAYQEAHEYLIKVNEMIKHQAKKLSHV